MQPEQTKLMLLPNELELVTNAEVILTKNRIIQKVYDLFAGISDNYRREAMHVLPAELTLTSPKISRGENYLGLPYVMLDYPRNFTKENTFAVRTFFWWGHFFSITLQLSGIHQTKYLPALKNAAESDKLKEWYTCISENEWHHHFEEDNYTINNHSLISENNRFIKLAKKLPLSNWETAPGFLSVSFAEIISILKN